MTGRAGALLLAAVLSLGAAQADDAQAPAVPAAPATTTPDTPPPAPAAPPPSTPDAMPPAPDTPPSAPDASPAPPDVSTVPPSPAGDVPLPASPEPAQPSTDVPSDTSKEAAPADVPKEVPKEAPKDVVQPPKNLEPIPKDTAITVLGKKVLGPEGEDMGRVTDLLLDRDAHIKSIVIDFGGFLGVGSRKIAIDWRLVRFVPDKPDAPIALSLGKVEVQAAPEYKDSAQPPVMVGPPPPPPPPPSPPPPPPPPSAPDAAR